MPMNAFSLASGTEKVLGVPCPGQQAVFDPDNAYCLMSNHLPFIVETPKRT